jgi:hypothetical protein
MVSILPITLTFWIVSIMEVEVSVFLTSKINLGSAAKKHSSESQEKQRSSRPNKNRFSDLIHL